jgi:hypothetical protein
MNSPVYKKISSPSKPSFYKIAVGLVGFIALFISLFTLQTNSQAASQGPKKGKSLESAIKNMKRIPIDKEYASAIRSEFQKTRQQRLVEPEPKVIPAGTKPNRVTFTANETTGQITAIADTNDDLTPEAREVFATADQNSAFTSFIVSRRTKKHYAGSISFDGADAGMGKISIIDNDADSTYKGTVTGSFSVGPGTPTGLALINSPQGDILLVATYFFERGRFDGTANDRFTVTAYLPGANGVPDGSQSMVIPINPDFNSTFGGMTTDSKGNLFINLTTTDDNSVGGLTAVFFDTDGDLLPDDGQLFADSTDTDLNPLTASSIVVKPNPTGTGSRVIIYGNNEVFGGLNRSQIAVYTDADGDLVADGPPRIFFTAPTQFRGFATDFGDGSSAVFTTSMDFGDDRAAFSYITVAGNNIAQGGVALVRDNGNGVGTGTMALIENPPNMGLYNVVSGVPNNSVPADATPPTVAVTSPNGGEMVMGGTNLSITFTSSDDTAVTTHDINLSTDGGQTFPVVVTSGLAGNVQSFTFPVPPMLDTPMARIQVVAKDAAGNMASDSSDANFTVIRAAVVDNTPPMVTISSPQSGAMLNGGSMATVNFTSTDNVAVSSHNILFAADGTNFSTTLVSGLPGVATSFTFRVPTISSTTAALRVEAVDSSGNRGNATVGQLTVVTDTQAPTVTVTSPNAQNKKLNGNSQFNVTFTSQDNTGVVSHDVQITLDGTNFMTLASGLPGTATSATVTIPNMKTKKTSAIRVIARDAAGNMGSGTSPAFKIKPAK